MIKRTAVVIVISVFAVASCKSNFKKTDSLIPIDNRKYENLGNVKGNDSAISVMGLWMIGKPDTRKAIKEALAEKNADTLINVTGSETSIWFILFSITTVKIEGEAIKFSEAKK